MLSVNVALIMLTTHQLWRDTNSELFPWMSITQKVWMRVVTSWSVFYFASTVYIVMNYNQWLILFKCMVLWYKWNHFETKQTQLYKEKWFRDGLLISSSMPLPAPTYCHIVDVANFPISRRHDVCQWHGNGNTAGNSSDTQWWALKTKCLMPRSSEIWNLVLNLCWSYYRGAVGGLAPTTRD